jgi:hypothetical protein
VGGVSEEGREGEEEEMSDDDDDLRFEINLSGWQVVAIVVAVLTAIVLVTVLR